jgi:hypothetical protein
MNDLGNEGSAETRKIEAEQSWRSIHVAGENALYALPIGVFNSYELVTFGVFDA